MHRTGLVLLATLGVGLVAAPAQAATVGVASAAADAVEFKAAGGKSNQVRVTRSGDGIVVRDRHAIRAGVGCRPVAGTRTAVFCVTDVPVRQVTVYTYDRNDSITSAVLTYAYGGTGNDTITGSPANDWLFGNSGADRILGGGGGDTVAGGVGDDVLHGNAGADYVLGGNGRDRMYGDAGNDLMQMDTTKFSGDDDRVSGGSGVDTVSYSGYAQPVVADLDGRRDDGARGERDTLLTDLEILYGGDGADRLYGTARNDDLNGGNGADTIYGGAGDDQVHGDLGEDRLFGGPGDDFLDGSDWLPDAVDVDLLDGGANRTKAGDRCQMVGDDVKRNCER